MLKHKSSSIDGFLSPNQGRTSGSSRPLPPTNVGSPALKTDDLILPRRASLASLSLEERIAEAKLVAKQLQDLDPPSSKTKKRFHFHRPTKRQVKWILVIIVVLLLIGGGLFAWKVLNSGSKVFKGNIVSAVASFVVPDKALKADQYGNTNLLLLGTSESDPTHPGAQLTDSIMIMSVNQTTHTAFLLSIPRDLWVQYKIPCSVGTAGKINATYECALNGGSGSNSGDEAQALAAVSNRIGAITGIDIQYTIHMNLAVIQQVVDAVGGIDITIDSPDPRGILDRNFDWRCNYKCYLVKYPNGPAHLTGIDAMWLAQARNDSGGYGLPRSNFDREANQRKILIATRDRATSVGFLANPLNSVKLLDAMGNNIHTTIDSSEIKTFVDVAKNTPSNDITSIDIMDNGPGILTTGSGPDGSSIVKPYAGLLDYTAVQAFTSKLLQGQAPLIQETAPVDIVNASVTVGAATQEATTLKQKGFNVGRVITAPSTYKSTAKYMLYDLSKGTKPGTLAALKKEFNATTIQTKLPDGIVSSATFVVVLGNEPVTTAKK